MYRSVGAVMMAPESLRVARHIMLRVNRARGGEETQCVCVGGWGHSLVYHGRRHGHQPALRAATAAVLVHLIII